MEANVRLSRPNDINVIRDLDIKCYDYPLEMAEWQDLLNTSGQDNQARCVLVEAYRKPLGFAVWKILPPEAGVNVQVCFLYRLGVRPTVRQKGLGRLLLKTCEAHATRMQADVIRTTVPDFKCKSGDPDDVSGFLSASGFMATGHIVDQYKFMYGKWVDGYIFEKQISSGVGAAC